MRFAELRTQRGELLSELTFVCQAMQSILDTVGLSWEDKFTQIFSDHISARFARLMHELGIEFAWTDPDGSYEDDVRAFAGAAIERGQQVAQAAAF